MSKIKFVVDVPGYPKAHSPYSHAVVANGLVFVSGQIPVRPGGGATEVVGTTMQEQTRQVLRNVETILKTAGSSLHQVVKVTVLLARLVAQGCGPSMLSSFARLSLPKTSSGWIR